MKKHTIMKLVQDICNRNGATITRQETSVQGNKIVGFTKGGLDWTVVISERLLDKQVNTAEWEIYTFGAGSTTTTKDNWLAYSLETLEKAMTDPSSIGFEIEFLMLDDDKGEWTAPFCLKCANWFAHQDVFRKYIDFAIDNVAKDDDDTDSENVDDFLTSMGL